MRAATPRLITAAGTGRSLRRRWQRGARRSNASVLPDMAGRKAVARAAPARYHVSRMSGNYTVRADPRQRTLRTAQDGPLAKHGPSVGARAFICSGVLREARPLAATVHAGGARPVTGGPWFSQRRSAARIAGMILALSASTVIGPTCL